MDDIPPYTRIRLTAFLEAAAGRIHRVPPRPRPGGRTTLGNWLATGSALGARDAPVVPFGPARRALDEGLERGWIALPARPGPAVSLTPEGRAVLDEWEAQGRWDAGGPARRR